MILRKCGRFLADGSGENEMSLWSVLTNTHKPPDPRDCPDVVRRGNRRFTRRVVIDEVLPEGRRPQTKPSMLTRLFRLARFGLWGGRQKPSEPQYQPQPPRPLPPPQYEPPQYVPPQYEPPPYEPAPPPPTQQVVKQRGPEPPGRLKRLVNRLVKTRNLFLSLPLLFVIPVLTFFLLRATYKRFFRRFKKRHRTRIRYAFIAAIFCSALFTFYKVLVTIYEIIFKD